ncbi:ATP-binding protein [Acinetobacter sp. WCHAc010034]|uniref:ATP-binding protein n=1 Tax=Acinetobacter sp. WCHAc010034 TaxID=1879049 RepID=UPI00083A5033|nr:ATP-binding protein [Acinetobacter sp. WCHAc010034]AYA02138.1 ATP-binding protein [Acinetobacter sp. WCHAc010034]
MALAIIPADQALNVSAIITYIYADPGLGKTSLGFTADKAISFDFDRGAHRTGELRRGAVVPVQQWADIENIKEQDLAPFNTVVIDTVGAMLESIKTHLLKTANNRQQDGALKLKAQGLANMKFKQYINTLLSFGKDVVFIAHASEDQNGDQVIYRPELGGKNRNELYRIADMMGYMTTVTTGEGKNARVINFKPSPVHHAKNSGALGGETGEVWVPDLKTNPTFLADLISDAKAHINTLTPAQLASAKALEDLENWKQSCEEAMHAGDLNQLTETLKLDKEHMYYQNMRQAMLARAKAVSCTFDKERDTWISPPEFNGINDAQRDDLQAFMDQCGLDAKAACEHLGIDSLMQIDSSQIQAVKHDLEQLAKAGATA